MGNKVLMEDDRESPVIQSYRDLKVWRLAMDLAEQCYKLTRQFPRDELYGMTSQVRRSAASVAANIAEGYGRNSRGEYIQFLLVAQFGVQAGGIGHIVAVGAAAARPQQG